MEQNHLKGIKILNDDFALFFMNINSEKLLVVHCFCQKVDVWLHAILYKRYIASSPQLTGQDAHLAKFTTTHDLLYLVGNGAPGGLCQEVKT